MCTCNMDAPYDDRDDEVRFMESRTLNARALDQVTDPGVLVVRRGARYYARVTRAVEERVRVACAAAARIAAAEARAQMAAEARAQMAACNRAADKTARIKKAAARAAALAAARVDAQAAQNIPAGQAFHMQQREQWRADMTNINCTIKQMLHDILQYLSQGYSPDQLFVHAEQCVMDHAAGASARQTEFRSMYQCGMRSQWFQSFVKTDKRRIHQHRALLRTIRMHWNAPNFAELRLFENIMDPSM